MVLHTNETTKQVQQASHAEGAINRSAAYMKNLYTDLGHLRLTDCERTTHTYTQTPVGTGKALSSGCQNTMRRNWRSLWKSVCIGLFFELLYCKKGQCGKACQVLEAAGRFLCEVVLVNPSCMWRKDISGFKMIQGWYTEGGNTLIIGSYWFFDQLRQGLVEVAMNATAPTDSVTPELPELLRGSTADPLWLGIKEYFLNDVNEGW